MHQAADYSLLGEPGRTSPPALPIKQRRSGSSSSSLKDVEVNFEDLHLSGPQTPLTPFAEVFISTDCNAIHCPIHHRYENHQRRFFSDQNPPPPVPKKRLKRTLSLPADARDPPFLPHTGNYNYENPLYMITPFHDQLVLREEHKEEQHEGQSMQRLTFDIPDEQLYSFRSYEQLSTGIQECYLQFLRKTLQNIEMSIFLNEQENKMVKTSQPTDFLLCGQQWTESDFYYLVYCPKVPTRLFAAKVHREDSASDCPIHLLHPNIEQGVVHFPQCPATNQTRVLKPENAPDPSNGGSTEACQQQTVVSLLEKGVSVTVVRDFPLGTLEDFVEEGHSLHCTHPEVYERRLCLLVLQLVTGLQHLGQYRLVHRELKPQSFVLVWPSVTWKVGDTREHLSGIRKGKDLNSDTSTGTSEKTVVSEGQLDIGKTKGEMRQTLWEKWGTPRLVLDSKFEGEVFKEATSQEHQLGNLLRYCLHLTHSDSPLCKVQQDTPYSPGLRWLVTQLTSEIPALLMADVASVLPVLLWGPRKELFQQNQLESSLFSNWLVIKRSFLVLKLAERGLFQEKHGLDWEDYLCLQYLSFTEPDTLHGITAHMGLHNSENSQFNVF